jgi:adenylate kinase
METHHLPQNTHRCSGRKESFTRNSRMATAAPQRTQPNILITGTPGTGKTSLAETICEVLKLTRININELVQQHQCHEGHDSEYDTLILDEDKLLDVMEPLMSEGGKVVDYHSCDFFPERWFDLVLVLQTTTEVLYDRLQSRGYSDKKINENMECEIMQIVIESARESYQPEIVHSVPSNTIEDMENNCERLKSWYENWMANNQQTH